MRVEMKEIFNEDQYLAANPDVAAAVMRNGFTSGLEHWNAFGKKEGRQLCLAKDPTSSSSNDLPHYMVEDKFVTVAPNAQNIIDLFQGEWSSKMPVDSQLISRPGHANLFDDHRVLWMEKELGPVNGMNIIELGPLEGAHSYMLEHLGAQSITAIESNTRAFLKCLCVKEVFNLKRVDFRLGDILPYLGTLENADLIFASGILYHMIDPLRLLNLICSKTDKFFLWTHYYDETVISQRADYGLFDRLSNIDSSEFIGSKRLYPEAALSWKGFSGGADSYAVWIERNSLLSFIDKEGFEVKINFDLPDHPNGPAFAICATRPSNRGQTIL